MSKKAIELAFYIFAFILMTNAMSLTGAGLDYSMMRDFDKKTHMRIPAIIISLIAGLIGAVGVAIETF